MDKETEGIVDLDILKPPKKIIKLGGVQIDVSFVPCGITWEIDSLVRKLSEYDENKLKDEKSSKEALDIIIKLCSTFASFKNPELSEKWFRENVEMPQINAFVSLIKEALIRSYAGVEQYGKN
ncbi:MAG TPA: hypothetical protein PK222_02150 [Bacteroidales bacterium]|jgi:hypothetical protein|nr:hypothetical protein [Bacteroidales bacterium]